jgi:hypothetical protein
MQLLRVMLLNPASALFRQRFAEGWDQMQVAGSHHEMTVDRAPAVGEKLKVRKFEASEADIEPRFVHSACGKRGADVRPDFNWNKLLLSQMGYR